MNMRGDGLDSGQFDPEFPINYAGFPARMFDTSREATRFTETLVQLDISFRVMFAIYPARMKLRPQIAVLLADREHGVCH